MGSVLLSNSNMVMAILSIKFLVGKGSMMLWMLFLGRPPTTPAGAIATKNSR